MSNREQNVIDLIDAFSQIDRKHIKKILDFKTVFSGKLQQEKNKLPYQVNIIDEIRANENAHSRILTKLLKYNNGWDYPILKSFYNHIGGPFSILQAKKPKITAEKDRIDIRIRDEDYSLIIENKIHGAPPQEKQVDNYIEYERDYWKNKTKVPEEKIYVLFLTKSGGSAPSIILSKENKEKLKLNNKYADINFRDHILPWLKSLLDNKDKESIIKYENNKEEIIFSAIIQYKNYLEGLFYLREGEQNMKHEMIKLINDKFKLDPNDKLSKQFEIADDYYKYVTELQAYLEQIKRGKTLDAIKKLEELLLSTEFHNVEEVRMSRASSAEFGTKSHRLVIRPKGWKDKYIIAVSFDNFCNDLYYTIYNYNNDSSHDFINKMKKLFGENDGNIAAYPFSKYVHKGKSRLEIIKRVENGDLYEELKSGINQLLKDISTHKEIEDELLI